MPASPRPPAGARESETDPDPSGEASATAELESLVQELRSDFGRFRDGVKRTVRVEWQRLRLRAVDALFSAAFLLCLVGFALAASISGAILVAAGLREALTRWTGTGWVGDLGAGLAVLGLVIGVGLAVRFHLRNDCVRRAKVEPAEEEPAGDGRR